MSTVLRNTDQPAPRGAGPTIPALLLRNAREHGDLPALSWRAADGAEWTTLTWAEVRDRVARLAAGYARLGVARGDHVLLMMGNRPEHWLTDLALVHLGAVPVTVYGTSAPDQVAYLARHSRARLAVVEGAAELARFEPLLDGGGTRLERLVVVDETAVGGHTPYRQPAGAEPAADFEERWRESDERDPLTVVYTSGTTGDPKGVVVSHRNVLLNAVALDKVVDLPPHVEHVCYLPLAHIAERMLGLYLPIHRASHVLMCANPQAVAATLLEVRPAQFFGVPRIWEKLAVAVRAGLAVLPAEQAAAVERASRTALAYTDCRERGEEPSAELAEAYRRANEEVLRPLLAMGGLDRLVWAASASAPMPVDVVRFWAGLGVVIMDAWGLTESVGVATANSPRAGFRLGSVGRPIDGVEIRTAEDGEILVRGGTIFDGYLQADGTVRPAVDADGWFATGDIGRVDEDGYLWITDRKKEMIITSTGKNVSPALVENTLKEHPLIGQALVHGDGRSYLVALLVLDHEMAPAWAAAHGIEVDGDPRALAGHPAVREEIDRAVAAANARLNRTEQVKRYRLLTEEWSPAGGELTPSLKLKRRVVREKYAAELESLYGG